MGVKGGWRWVTSCVSVLLYQLFDKGVDRVTPGDASSRCGYYMGKICEKRNTTSTVQHSIVAGSMLCVCFSTVLPSRLGVLVLVLAPILPVLS